jgi:single-strand DNA-binding protein
MNKFIGLGRVVRDPEVRYSQGENASAVAKYTLAIDRKFKQEGQPTADFINCVCFGRSAEFAEKYLRQGTKIAIVGRIQTGSYTNRDGQKVYTTDIVVEEQEFCEKKESQDNELPKPNPSAYVGGTDFMDIPECDQGELPFN